MFTFFVSDTITLNPDYDGKCEWEVRYCFYAFYNVPVIFNSCVSLGGNRISWSLTLCACPHSHD